MIAATLRGLITSFHSTYLIYVATELGIFEAMTARIPNARSCEIPQTNHYTILIGHPPETAAAIRDFLAD